jgi:hypothetical protein
MHRDLVLERKSINKLNVKTQKEKIKHIAEAAERNKSLGFVGVPGKFREPEVIMEGTEEKYRYLVKIRLKKTNSRGDEGAFDKQIEHVKNVVAKCANTEGWAVVGEGEPSTVEEKAALQEPAYVPRTAFVVPELTAGVMEATFEGVYDRDAHIRTIHDAARMYFDTLARNKEEPQIEVSRSHVLLKGKPAGCKTTLFERFKVWYEQGSQTERVLFVDGQTMTKAGLENYLLDRADSMTLPEIIVLEEIEKQDQNNLLTLVSLMGSGYVAKLNAKVGHRKAIANVLIWATCNDEEVIKTFRKGVLWSRFAHKLHCVRPSRERMQQILNDRVRKMSGNPVWVLRALEFAYETMRKEFKTILDDPREIKGLLDGRDRLLDGSYQKDILEILRAEMEEKNALETQARLSGESV